MSDANSILEREAALTLKEQEMKKLEQSLDSRIKELEAARKGLEAPLARKKTEDSGRYKKMLKVYKSLRPEEAAALMDKLDEGIALQLLDQMDQKTAAKLIPFLNQARVLKWTSQSLKEN
jgi:flagellar motility protein MotE (MotC chaperone)